MNQMLSKTEYECYVRRDYTEADLVSFAEFCSNKLIHDKDILDWMQNKRPDMFKKIRDQKINEILK